MASYSYVYLDIYWYLYSLIWNWCETSPVAGLTNGRMPNNYGMARAGSSRGSLFSYSLSWKTNYPRWTTNYIDIVGNKWKFLTNKMTLERKSPRNVVISLSQWGFNQLTWCALSMWNQHQKCGKFLGCADRWNLSPLTTDISIIRPSKPSSYKLVHANQSYYGYSHQSLVTPPPVTSWGWT